MANLKAIAQIVPNSAPRWSYLLSAVQVHTTTHCNIYREQLDHAPPKTGPGCLEDVLQ